MLFTPMLYCYTHSNLLGTMPWFIILELVVKYYICTYIGRMKKKKPTFFFFGLLYVHIFTVLQYTKISNTTHIFLIKKRYM